MSQVIDNPDNSAPKPVVLLKNYGISMRGIARGLGVSPDTVRDVLSLEQFRVVGHENTTRIRLRIEALLEAWGEDVSDLWAEYDRQLEDAA
ncbi:MAG: hypothetical protein SV201_05750 [Pseudomonadota bacterium]|nr:hypothetical protein [Pseudomonadota bacterium]